MTEDKYIIIENILDLWEEFVMAETNYLREHPNENGSYSFQSFIRWMRWKKNENK